MRLLLIQGNRLAVYEDRKQLIRMTAEGDPSMSPEFAEEIRLMDIFVDPEKPTGGE